MRISALALLLAVLPAAAAHITVIGDSLTKEYQVTFPGLSALGLDGIDVTHPGARNWSEILHAQRNAHFDLGRFRNTVVLDMFSDTRLLGHEYNWAVPGATSRALRLLLTDPDSDELLEEPDVGTILSLASEWRNVPQRLSAQLASRTAAAVIWLGGNDLRFGSTDPAAKVAGVKVRYQTIYDGDGTGAGDPAPLMGSIRDNIQAIASFVRAAHPSLPIVVIAVPHIGCAPAVQAAWPTDAVRTGRITAALTALNGELRSWTENSPHMAFVDIFPYTVELIVRARDLGCIQFSNTADNRPAAAPAAAHNRFIFAHDGFHPTTTFQGRVAQEVQATLREKWPAAFGASPPLTDRELVTTVLGIPASTGFTEFMAASGAPSARHGPLDDPDGDGVPNLMEFALAGHDPWRSSRAALPQAENAGGAALLRWTPACAQNIYAAPVCEWSGDLTQWSAVPAAAITAAADGTFTARVPYTSGAPVYLRLKVTAAP